MARRTAAASGYSQPGAGLTVKERPILFSGPMVRALLDGRKTQTRRIVKCTGHWSVDAVDNLNGDRWPFVEDENGEWEPIASPFGGPGERFWVKEGLRRIHWQTLEEGGVAYAVDAEPAWDLTQPCAWGWKRDTLPGMFCPRGLSRITLEVTAIRVERLQDISEEDAAAEGVPPMLGSPQPIAPAYRDGFRQLWDSINRKRAPWSSNPWVWVVHFKRIEATS